MYKIIVEFRPFVMNQNIYVFDNDKTIDAASVNIDRVTDVVSGFKNKYGAEEIILHGNEDYLKKYQKDFLTKYHHNVEVIIKERD